MTQVQPLSYPPSPRPSLHPPLTSFRPMLSEQERGERGGGELRERVKPIAFRILIYPPPSPLPSPLKNRIPARRPLRAAACENKGGREGFMGVEFFLQNLFFGKDMSLLFPIHRSRSLSLCSNHDSRLRPSGSKSSHLHPCVLSLISPHAPHRTAAQNPSVLFFLYNSPTMI